jgi:hypothetical protein
MSNLKTTKEERAAARARSSGIHGSGSELAARMADDLDTLEKLLEERDIELHMRIRAGYDRCIADTWRAEVAKAKLRADTLEAEVERLRGELKAQDEELDRVNKRMGMP